jgi:translation initiation factor 2B subunit (eIF-2B alpha/beta/delta family)
MEVARKFRALELHAARAGREVFETLVQVVLDSPARDSAALATEIEQAVDALLGAMPAYAPPLNAICRVSTLAEAGLRNGLPVQELKTAFNEERNRFRLWSQEAREKTALVGAELIRQGHKVFTFTFGETVMRVLSEAVGQGKAFRVRVTESSPNRDGVQTASALAEIGVPVELSIDACMAELIAGCDLMLVGAEAITAVGSAVCKVGTYPAALVARANNVPVYVVVDSSKFNLLSLYSIPLVLDHLRRQDVLPNNDRPDVQVEGHLFDETPQTLISALVTERGLMHPVAAAALMRELPFSSHLFQKLSAWSLSKESLSVT